MPASTKKYKNRMEHAREQVARYSALYPAYRKVAEAVKDLLAARGSSQLPYYTCQVSVPTDADTVLDPGTATRAKNKRTS